MRKLQTKDNKKAYNGITLIALVTTIVVLLILSGVSINLILGDNGIINKAQQEEEKEEEAYAKEKVELSIAEYPLAPDNQSFEDFLNSKVPNDFDDVKKNEDGNFEIKKGNYIITVDENGKIKDVSKSGPTIKIENIMVVANKDGTGTAITDANSIELGNELYITFTHSIEGGTTTVDKTIPYAVTENGIYKFTITGNVKGKEYKNEVSVSVNQFDNTNYNIYAVLYDDGTLSLGNTDEAISGKNISKQYGNIKGNNYNLKKDSNGAIITDTPWFEDKDNIKNINILNTI